MMIIGISLKGGRQPGSRLPRKEGKRGKAKWSVFLLGWASVILDE
jgi:hypothetical protein